MGEMIMLALKKAEAVVKAKELGDGSVDLYLDGISLGRIPSDSDNKPTKRQRTITVMWIKYKLQWVK
jgi:hypothetical protein